MPRTQCSAPSAVRCRAGAHGSERSLSPSGSRPCAAALHAAARPGHGERWMHRRICLSGKTPRTPSTPSRKNIPLYRNSELRHRSTQPGPTKRGGSRVVRNAGRVAMDAAASCARGAGRAGSPCEPEASCGRAAPKSGEASWRSRMCCVRQNRVVLAVVATVKPVRRCARAQPGGRHHPIRTVREARRKVRLPGERGISRPTIAQGRPSDRRHLYAAVRSFRVCISRGRPRVPVGTRPSLRPFLWRGEE